MERVKIHASIVDDATVEQVYRMAGSDAYKDCTVRIMPDCHVGKGCTIGSVIQYENRVVPSTVGVDISCLDCDTEVLTPNGWIRIADYNDQEIMQYSPETDFGKFAKPTGFIKSSCDKFYHFKNSKGLDQMLSEEHRMLVYQGHKGSLCPHVHHPKFFIERKNLIKGYYTFKTCFNTEEAGLDISDEILRICVMVQADGHIRKYDDYIYVEQHVKKERKVIRTKELLEAAGIKYRASLGKDGSTYFSFHAPLWVDKDLTKFYRASLHQLQVITEECLLWDGHKGYRSFYSPTNKANADFIQFAYIASNVRASIYKPIVDDTRKDSYFVIPTKNPYVGYTIRPTVVPSKDGYKYCFVTDSGYFLCRRNNYTFLTGNCGMAVAELGKVDIDPKELDDIIHHHIPSGQHVRTEPVRLMTNKFIAPIHDWTYIQCSLGTLGGGNHFIELDTDEEGYKYLVVHSGSRNLGKQVCEYWQEKAYANLTDDSSERKVVIERLKAEGRQKDIQSELVKMKKPVIDKDLAYLEGKDMEDYLHDMKLCQEFASWNRWTIIEHIMEHANLERVWSRFETLHNYIDIDNKIIRKGAISAQKGEKVLIPINMRDGSLICVGKGNSDWLYSAPHGAGRLMSRAKARESLNMIDYKTTMNGIYTTSVCEETIDEAPMAYKPINVILKDIQDTVEVVKRIYPIYNFKAKE